MHQHFIITFILSSTPYLIYCKTIVSVSHCFSAIMYLGSDVTITLSQYLPAIMYLCSNLTVTITSWHNVSLVKCHYLTVTVYSCHNVSVIMSLSYCHNVSLLLNHGSKYHSAKMPLCLSESCSTSVLILMVLDAKHDFELAEFAFAEVGGYAKGRKCLSKVRKETTLEVIDVICWNFVSKSCACINMEE